jgi:cytoskeletal protein CcmA (bactofilin family)
MAHDYRTEPDAQGDLTADEDITVDYHRRQPRAAEDRLVVTEHAQLNATVTAASVMVSGHLDGHISTELLQITSSAVVNAGVVTTKLSLQDGAQFNGPVNTDRAKAAASVAKHRQKA